MSDYTINRLRYHVEVAGDGRSVVLLHGFTGRAANWRGLAAGLATRFRVIAVDLPGHGGSDAPADPARYRMEEVTADLVTLLERLDAAPADWVGYSMGGRLALHVAIARPALVRRLVLESATPGLETGAEQAARRAQDESLAMRLEADGIAAFTDYWQRQPLFASQSRLPEETRAALRAQRLDNRVHGLAGSLRGMGTGVQPSLWSRLGEITHPVLLIAGELDEKFVAINRRAAAILPRAELRIAGNAGHAVHLERPAWFADTVRAFLDRQDNAELSAADSGNWPE